MLSLLLQVPVMLAIDVEVDKNQISSGAQSTSPFDFFKNIFREKTDTQQAAKSQQVQRSVLSERPVNKSSFESLFKKEVPPLSFSHDTSSEKFTVPFKSKGSLPAEQPVEKIELLTPEKYANILQKGHYFDNSVVNLNFYKTSQEVLKNTKNLETLSFVLTKLSEDPELQAKLNLRLNRKKMGNDDISKILQDFKSKMLAQQNAAVKS